MSEATSFFDLFFDWKSEKHLVKKAGGLLLKHKKPASFGFPAIPESGRLHPKRKFRGLELLVAGKGTIAVSSDANTLLRFALRPEEPNGNTLCLQIGLTECVLSYGDMEDDTVPNVILPTTVLKNARACYINPGTPTTYWLSLDNPNGVISYGKYYMNKSMTLLEVNLKHRTEGGIMTWSDAASHSWLEYVKRVTITQDRGVGVPSKIRILPLTVVIDLSPIIMSGQMISLLDVEHGAYTAPANLPRTCQDLYGNVGGPNIVLDTPDFPEFSKAIHRSCQTPGLLGYNMLKAKSGTFGHDDMNGTYLRITLGYNMGDSPGVPYVLEVWPVDHFSPVHDHGDSNGIIKTIHGTIEVSYFDSLTAPDGPNQIGNALQLRKDMVTWIGQNNYQVHQLHNTSNDVCVTLNAYRYEAENNVHCDIFRYIEGNEEHEFRPNSDMAYSEFLEAINAEWVSRPYTGH